MKARRAIERRWIAAGSDIVEQGSRPNALHVIVSGVAHRYQLHIDGSRRIVGLLFPGDPCDACQFMTPESAFGVRALTRTEIATFSQQKVNEDREFQDMLKFHAMRENVILRQTVVKLGHLKARARMANMFYDYFLWCAMFDLLDPHDDATFIMPFTQRDMADFLGIALVHVNRLMHKLRKDNLIVNVRRRLTIVDDAGLRRTAEFDIEQARTIYGSRVLARCGLEPSRPSHEQFFCRWMLPSISGGSSYCGNWPVISSDYCQAHYLPAFIARRAADSNSLDI